MQRQGVHRGAREDGHRRGRHEHLEQRGDHARPGQGHPPGDPPREQRELHQRRARDGRGHPGVAHGPAEREGEEHEDREVHRAHEHRGAGVLRGAEGPRELTHHREERDVHALPAQRRHHLGDALGPQRAKAPVPVDHRHQGLAEGPQQHRHGDRREGREAQHAPEHARRVGAVTRRDRAAEVGEKAVGDGEDQDPLGDVGDPLRVAEEAHRPVGQRGQQPVREHHVDLVDRHAEEPRPHEHGHAAHRGVLEVQHGPREHVQPSQRGHQREELQGAAEQRAPREAGHGREPPAHGERHEREGREQERDVQERGREGQRGHAAVRLQHADAHRGAAHEEDVREKPPQHGDRELEARGVAAKVARERAR